MAKVTDVQEVSHPSGLLFCFTISDDRTPPNMITVSFKTRDEAEDAVDMVRDAFAGRGQRRGTARAVSMESIKLPVVARPL